MNTIRCIRIGGGHGFSDNSNIDKKRRPGERVVALKDGGHSLIVYFERDVPFRSRIRTRP